MDTLGTVLHIKFYIYHTFSWYSYNVRRVRVGVGLTTEY